MKKKGYIASFENDNDENDFHHTTNNAHLQDDGILSGCLYIDTDGTWEHPTTRLVSAIANHHIQMNDATLKFTLPAIIYQTHGQAVFLNDWDDPNFFMATSLFLHCFHLVLEAIF